MIDDKGLAGRRWMSVADRELVLDLEAFSELAAARGGNGVSREQRGWLGLERRIEVVRTSTQVGVCQMS